MHHVAEKIRLIFVSGQVQKSDVIFLGDITHITVILLPPLGGKACIIAPLAMQRNMNKQRLDTLLPAHLKQNKEVVIFGRNGIAEAAVLPLLTLKAAADICGVVIVQKS